MKIYTRTGDDGTTGLIGAARVSKADLRVECFGAIDELNATLGIAAVVAEGTSSPLLRQIQNDLFVIGSHLAAPDARLASVALPPLSDQITQRLEAEIDAAQSKLPVLRCFILPGGSELAARLHFARTLCRRAERVVVALTQREPVPVEIVIYLNRLADWLFVHARLANHLAGVADIAWTK